jgi:hypothetical protein
MANHYVNAILGRNCYEELSTLFACTNNPMKEISESYAAYSNMKHLFNETGEKLDDYINLHIGDGSTCRTGAMFTFLTKSYNISVDPAVNMDRVWSWMIQYEVKHFEFRRCLWQETAPSQNGSMRMLIHVV